MKKIASKLNILILVCVMLNFTNVFGQEGNLEINQDSEIEALLKIKKSIESKSSKYKIQIYSGPNRSSAESVRTEFLENYSDWPSSLEYETPNYKIWVGDFKSRLQADRALIRIKKKFINAFIFQPNGSKKRG
ncbi:MAG: SPOR domain-containing protein [Melioribacteraceae bacterium]|nr:SPOR domain-containing protein [Melioribacteraceae bacterium]